MTETENYASKTCTLGEAERLCNFGKWDKPDYANCCKNALFIPSNPSQLQPPVPAGELQDGAVLHFPVCGARERGGVRAAGAARAGGRGVHDRRHQDPGFLHARDGRERTVLPQLRAGAGELHGADLRAQRLLVREHSGAESAAAGKPVRVPVHDAELRQHGFVRGLRFVLGDHQQ